MWLGLAGGVAGGGAPIGWPCWSPAPYGDNGFRPRMTERDDPRRRSRTFNFLEDYTAQVPPVTTRCLGSPTR
jgi:hypothetical protein